MRTWFMLSVIQNKLHYIVVCRHVNSAQCKLRRCWCELWKTEKLILISDIQIFPSSFLPWKHCKITRVAVSVHLPHWPNRHNPHDATHDAQMCRWGTSCSDVGLSFSPVNNCVIQECCYVSSVFLNPSYLPLIPDCVRGSDLICEGRGLLYISHIKHCSLMMEAEEEQVGS